MAAPPFPLTSVLSTVIQLEPFKLTVSDELSIDSLKKLRVDFMSHSGSRRDEVLFECSGQVDSQDADDSGLHRRRDGPDWELHVYRRVGQAYQRLGDLAHWYNEPA